MNTQNKVRAALLTASLLDYSENVEALPGLEGDGCVDSFVGQLIDSLRRIEFAHHIRDAKIGPLRSDPKSDVFDPLRAAVLHNRQGNLNEAWWLVFLATHFGKHHAGNWELLRNVYGKLGQGGLWNWAAIVRDPQEFERWLEVNEAHLKNGAGKFSNHRKYESLKVTAENGTAAVFATYVTWVGPSCSHSEMIRTIHTVVGQNPEAVFEHLYKSMSVVKRFGRLGRFDFLAMLGKLGIAPVEPGSAFLVGATGPLSGARLLYGGHVGANISARELNSKLIKLGSTVGLGMQVLEDALCNWQKSPTVYKPFRG